MICKSCKIDKPIEDYSLHRLKSYDYRCKKCYREYHRKYYWKNHNKLKPLRTEASRKWHKNNKEKSNSICLKHYYKNKEKLNEKSKKYSKDHREERTKYKREYKKKNPEKWKKYNREYSKLRMKNINHRILHNLRNRIYEVTKNNYKYSYCIDYLSCSIHEFKEYLKSKFKNGMTFENYGKVWHIDHIKPCKLFNMSNKNDQKKCFHYTNLQPLFVIDNLKKGYKFNRRIGE